MIGSVVRAFVFIGILGGTLSAFTQQPTSDTKLDPAIFDSYLGTYQFPAGYKGPILAVFRELDAQTPVAAVVPRFTEAMMARPASDFTVSVFANASHVMLEATRASDAEARTPATRRSRLLRFL